MKLRLSVKFLLLYIAIAAASFILISTLGSRLISRWMISRESLSMYETANEIADEYSDKSISTRSETDYSELNIIAVMDDISVQIISNSGTVYIDTAHDYSDDSLYTIEDFDPSAFDSGYYSIGDFFGYFSSDTLSVLVPITSSMNIRGYVAVHMSMSTIYSERESVLANIHFIEIIILLFTLSIIIMMNFWVFNPVRKITEAARQIAAGNYKDKVEIKQKDEMGYLAETLNYMADEMAKANEIQHKFISNVSHDFRTPLTSIKGYVEAIKDNVIPYEMQDKYLNIILSETKRLTKLTEELLSLDNIDNRIKKTNYTSFNINKLIKDTALSFEITCVSRKIIINLSLEGSELMVYADYGKIQQVMYNLLDNAIKFSHNGSSVDIETTHRNKKVYISVKDHGIGISNRELPKIWNRFYKADSSRGRDKTGSGLGLAIVREIIQSHEQKINVVSTKGVGTEFSFTLNADESMHED